MCWGRPYSEVQFTYFLGKVCVLGLQKNTKSEWSEKEKVCVTERMVAGSEGLWLKGRRRERADVRS